MPLNDDKHFKKRMSLLDILALVIDNIAVLELHKRITQLFFFKTATTSLKLTCHKMLFNFKMRHVALHIN